MAEEVKDERPPPPTWLDKELIQRVLEDVTVVSCDVRMANAVGDGYASDMYRVIARLEDSTERSVVVKCQPRGGMREEVVKEWGAFVVETEMFTNILPKMHDILEKASPGTYKPFSAKCLYHSNDPVPFIVLEDLKELGFTMAKRQHGVDLDHCILAIKTLARFLATSFALYDQNPKYIQYFDKGLYSGRIPQFLSSFLESGLSSLSTVVKTWPGYEKYFDKINEISETFPQRLEDTTERKENGYNCLIHGDPWTGNMMFKYSKDGVVDLRLVDFQTAHYTSPALDLQYFLHTCPSEDVRIKHMDHLFQEYHSTLTEILHLLSCSNHEISLENLKKEFETHAFFGFYAACIVLPIVLSDPEDGFDFEGTLKSDSEEGSKDKNIMLYNKEQYIKAMKRLLPIFERNGVF